jgi:very-short-patch-repair endonuclease
MGFDERSLAEVLVRKHGVVTHDDLRSLGMTTAQLRHLRVSGRLRTVRAGIHVSTATPSRWPQQLVIATAAADGVISHQSAGRLWDFRRVPATSAAHVTIQAARRVAGMNEVIVHRSNLLAELDVVRRHDGIAVTSPPRTVFDLASLMSYDDLESIIEQGLDRELFAMPTLWATARRLGCRGRAGSGRFERVLAHREPWQRPVQSDLELRLERALVQARLPRPVRQHPIDLGDGVTVHVDLAWPVHRVLIEVDHVTWHGGRADAGVDKWRDRQLNALGWRTLRVDDRDIRDRLPEVVRDVARVLAQPPRSTVE